MINFKKYSSLEEIVIESPHIRLANENDNKVILDFYHQKVMTGKDQTILYKRGDDFFAFLKERSEHFLVFTLWEDQNCKNKLMGIAVVSYRMGFINGEKMMIGYLGDLRVGLSRKLIREWREMYTKFITYSHLLPETKFCRYYQTVLIHSNQSAKANLVHTKIDRLKYKELAGYKMINIIGRLKIPFNKSSIKIESASIEELPQLITFLNEDDKKRLFGRDWSEELPYRLKNWSNFTIENILMAKDVETNELLAVTSFWNPVKTKQVITNKIPTLFKMIVPLLNLIPFIELKKIPVENRPIQILYLNQIHYKQESKIKQKILNAFINYLFNEDFNMLALFEFQRKNNQAIDFHFIKHSINMGFYSVHFIDENQFIRDDLSIDENSSDPGFDMALV
jgi:hypothetical protein